MDQVATPVAAPQELPAEKAAESAEASPGGQRQYVAVEDPNKPQFDFKVETAETLFKEKEPFIIIIHTNAHLPSINISVEQKSRIGASLRSISALSSTTKCQNVDRQCFRSSCTNSQSSTNSHLWTSTSLGLVTK